MRYKFDICADRETTNAEKYIKRKQLFGTDDVIPMWVADMDIDTPDFILKSINQRLKHPIFGYETMPISALTAQVKWMQKYHNINFETDNLLYLPSVVAGMNVAIEAFSDISDKIIVQTPVYSPFFKSIKNHKREVLYNPLKQDKNGRYTFDIEDLIAKIDDKTKLLLLCSPHNPVGRVWTKDELDRLADVCLRYNIIVFSDEIHSDLVYESHKHTTFASLSEKIKNVTITAMGTGKTFNMAGFAISTVAIPNDELRAKFKKVYDRIHFAQPPVLSHEAFKSAYKHGDDWLRDFKIHLLSNLELLYQTVSKHKNLISFIKPEGTYLAWLDCSKMELSDKELREFFVKEAKLGLSAGILFSKEGKGFMRLNFAVSTEIMIKAMKQLDIALENFNG